MGKSKYIYDCLYGAITFMPEIYDIINVPELQRLREVRLCNINSLSITGSANINRYEHSIGTCYLAKICIEEMEKENPFIDHETKTNFIRAALLHDIANAPFGHSLEYIIEKEGFNPEEGFRSAIQGINSKDGFSYKNVTHENVFFDMPRELAKYINENEIENIGQFIRGDGVLGKLLCGTIDLDNIDNVYRMAFHMGIDIDKSIPLKLARSFKLIGDEILVDECTLPLFIDWYYTREKMYKLLLLNPDEFSGKCMLSECIDSINLEDNRLLTWCNTDYEMLQKIADKESSTFKIKKFIKEFLDIHIKNESELKNYLALHYDEEFLNGKVIKHLPIGYEIRYKNNIYSMECLENSIKLYKYIIKKVDVSAIIKRLMCGELYGCIGIYKTTNVQIYNKFLDAESRFSLELDAEESVNRSLQSKVRLNIAFHPILDKNKTNRRFKVKTLEGNEKWIGESSNHLLIGAFIKNKAYSTFKVESKKEYTNMKKVDELIYDYLKVVTEDSLLKRIELYEESDDI